MKFSPTFNPHKTFNVSKIGNSSALTGPLAYRSEYAKADGKTYLFHSFEIEEVYLDNCKNFEEHALQLIEKITLRKGSQKELHLQDENGEIWQYLAK